MIQPVDPHPIQYCRWLCPIHVGRRECRMVARWLFVGAVVATTLARIAFIVMVRVIAMAIVVISVTTGIRARADARLHAVGNGRVNVQISLGCRVVAVFRSFDEHLLIAAT